MNENHRMKRSMTMIEVMKCVKNLAKSSGRSGKAKRGKLIVLEGIDGSGKTTIWNLLKNQLDSNRFVFSREPTDSHHGQKIRSLLAENTRKSDYRKIFELFLEDRKWHLENVIIPALREGRHVILDRFYLSTIAYQGVTGIKPPHELYELCMKHSRGIVPDLIIFLHVPLNVALERINYRTLKENMSRTAYEKEDFLKTVSAIYRTYLPKFRHVIIDATRPPEKVFKSVLETIYFYLNQKYHFRAF